MWPCRQGCAVASASPFSRPAACALAPGTATADRGRCRRARARAPWARGCPLRATAQGFSFLTVCILEYDSRNLSQRLSGEGFLERSRNFSKLFCYDFDYENFFHFSFFFLEIVLQRRAAWGQREARRKRIATAVFSRFCSGPGPLQGRCRRAHASGGRLVAARRGRQRSRPASAAPSPPRA